MNKTIAIDIRLLGKKRTGDEAVFFNLTKELLALDQEQTYMLMTDIVEPQKIAIVQGELGCVGQENVHFVSLRGKNRFVWNLCTLPWFLFRHKIDIYHTQYIAPFFVPRRTKLVTHIHDVSFAAYPQFIGLMDRFFLTLLIPFALRKAALVVAPSQFTKDEITRYYQTSSEKIAVIPNALSDSFLADSSERGEQIRKKYGLPARYIVYVGTLQPRKNIPFLIEAFSLLKHRLPELGLVLVGNRKAHHVDPGIGESLARSPFAQDVLFPGYIDQHDLPGLIHEAELFVFPSLYEGFGIPLLEAMSQGVPVAASDIPCLREIAADAAVYFDPRSLASCEETLYTLCTHQEQRAEAVFKGKARFPLFSWQYSAKILLERYQAL